MAVHMLRIQTLQMTISACKSQHQGDE